MLRYKKNRTWFSCLLWHPARKWSGSVLTTWELAQGSQPVVFQRSFKTTRALFLQVMMPFWHPTV